MDQQQEQNHTKRNIDQVDGSDSRENSNHKRQQTGLMVYKEPSIFNTRPMDDITKVIHDFISKYTGRPNVEIEAKFGTFVDRQTRQRFQYDCETETVIPQHVSRQLRFESNMPLEQHKYYNDLLNDLVNKSNAPDYKGERIKYRHTRETDRFHEVGNKKYRVTLDQKSGQIVPNGIIEKVRLEDLNIHSPTRPLDFRISINLEIPRPKPDIPYSFERNKDRLSYQHGGFNFDLTQVKGGQTNDMEVRHELELEFIDMEQLHAEKLKLDRKELSSFVPSIERFVNNIRMLSKHAVKMH